MLKPAAIRFAGLLACGLAGTAGATAQLSLSNSTATLTQTGETEWALAKSGSLNSATSTVTWQVLATQEDDVPGRLRINGSALLSNSGSTAATLGNVVVNLQARAGNRWVTVASDVADATNGDAAVSASIAPKASSEGSSSFVESAASGSLTFEIATSGTAFSLVPQQVVAPGASVPLSYTAEFDNGVLTLPDGVQVRAELIVSFGNAARNPSATPSVDINGNGIIDADETWVRSVAARTTHTVPAPVSSEAPTLSDTLDDITTTGTVTFSNAMFNLGATSGTVTASVDGGTDGGTITNCAHLTGVGVDLEACSTVAVEADGEGCTPGAPGCGPSTGWNTGDALTRTQVGWDGTTSWYRDYDAIYASSSGIVEVGIPGPSGFSLRFTGPDRVTTFLPQSGAAGALTVDLVDTTSSSSGGFGGQTLALRMNVDFSAAGALGPVAFGTLRLCAMDDTSLNNRTVDEVLGIANILLGGGSNGYSISAVTELVIRLNNAFVDGVPSTFAQNNLVNGSCP